MARITSLVLRLASLSLPTDIPLSIAAGVFLQAGVVIIFIVNIVFTQRILRAIHRNSAWHPLMSIVFKVIYALIIVTIAMVITVVVQSFYTLKPNIHRIDRDIQIYGTTFFAIVSFLPIPLIIAGYLLPRSSPVDKFGTGRFRHKIWILLFASTLICFGASYRAAVTWTHPVPKTQPLPKFMGKGPFYIVYFTVEITVLYLYGFVRVDQRFHIPNGAHGPGSYGAGRQAPGMISTGDVDATSYPDAAAYDEDEADRKSDKDLEKGDLKSPAIGSPSVGSPSIGSPEMQHYQEPQAPTEAHRF
jgi:Protein of unknown function (DUF3112)